MRIQHNIMAMNAYRNYNNNTSALSKNLEKLSSGYKINRAGDDAAGLAISEKMRAQITGLNAATKNVKDGISFVKTAEGAMQEIEDMLNRMKYLATQSANGTYDDPVDRANLDKEVTALKSEINRIAESANFNGIYMLNGGGGGGTTATAPTAPAAEVDTTDAAGIGTVTVAFDANATDTQKTALSTALAGKSFKVAVDEQGGDATVDAGDFVKVTGLPLPQGYTATFKDESGADAAFTDGTGIEIGTGAGKLKAGDDLVLTIKDDANNTVGTITIGAPTKATANADTAESTVTFAAAAANGAAGQADAAGAADAAKAPSLKADDTQLAAFDIKSIDVSGVKSDIGEGDKLKLKYDGDGTDGTFTATIGTKTFTGKVGDTAANLGGTTLELTGADAADGKITITFADTVTNVGTDKVATGDSITEAEVGELTPAGGGDANGAGGMYFSMTLQIGDDAASYNQLTVSIGSMKTDAFMGQEFTMTTDPKSGVTTYTATGGQTIDAISIADPTSAAGAIDTIKQAINYVSSVRGDLGALQNRLDHTKNNLSVMTENIQDAESTIRDTDVAEEMMAYTKNNILIQSAQAMLAQANAVPQGVLQLLG